MSNNPPGNAQSGSGQSIPGFDYEYLQVTDDVINTTLQLAPSVQQEAPVLHSRGLSISALINEPVQESETMIPGPVANPSHDLAPVSAPITRPVQESKTSVTRPHTQSPASRSPWSPEEISKLFSLRQSGMKWEDIYKELPGRDHTAIRRQYDVSLAGKRRDAAVDILSADEGMLAKLRRKGID
jgi:hypothetical protein